jgi:hypothetical protein
VEESRFWQLIESSRNEVIAKSGLPKSAEPKSLTADIEPTFIECLRQRLNTLSPDEIIAYRDEFDRKTIGLYRWDLWAIAYIIHQGCSDDYFDSFITWIICQGRDFYESALKDPIFISENAQPGQNLVFESVGYLPYEVYEEKTGLDLPGSGIYINREPSGQPWMEDSNLPCLFPSACKKFGFIVM